MFGRSEYLNENMLWYRTRAVSDSVSSKSAAVSPGKPTIMSVVIEMPGTVVAHAVDEIEVRLARVAASHHVQDPGRARLDGQMEVLADLRQVRHRAQQPIGDVPRMRTGESDALDPWTVVDRFEQPGEVARRVVGGLVVIHDLPEQLHFLEAAACRVAHFREDLRFRPHPLVAARVRDHAEAAVLVAAFDDCHPGANRIARGASARTETRRCRVRRGRTAFAGSYAAWSISIGSIRVRRVPTMTSTSGERDASDSPSCCATHPATATMGSRPVSSLEHAQLAEPRVQLLLGVLAHAAGVDHDHVRIRVLRGALVPCRSSNPAICSESW